MGGNHRTCVICGLKERHKQSSGTVMFAAFPRDENRCREWLRVVGNEELVLLPIEKLVKRFHVCGIHFHQNDFNKKGNRLKRHAIPVLHLTAIPLSDDQLTGFPQHMWKDKMKDTEVSRPEELPSTSKGTYIEIAAKQVLNAPLPGEVPSTSECTNVEFAAKQVLNAPLLEELPSTSECTTVEVAERQIFNEQKSKESNKKPDVTDGRAKGVKRKLDESMDLSPRKRKLVKQLVRTKCTLKSLRKSAILIEKIDSPVLKEFVLNACKNQRRNPKGRRWTCKNKISALAIFKRSPKTYRYLSTAMPLPSEKTLQTLLKKIPIQPGINKAVLNHLKEIGVDKEEKQKTCCLLFDEMAIKPRLLYNMAIDHIEGYVDLGDGERSQDLADHALVFMLQGLHYKFKQPIGFFFVKGTISSGKLSVLIKKIIEEVASAGFQIVTTVCDQGPTNIGALRLLINSSGPRQDESNNFFIVNGKKIFIIFDIPHLFKSIRNNFQKNGTILFNGKKAQWSHLQEVEEKNRNFLYLSKITPTHVDPKFRAKMKVKYAVQILSNTVAAVLKLLSKGEEDPQHANQLMDSALVIEDLDKLFDYTNGPSCPENIKKGQRENVSATTGHTDRWADYIKKISTMKFIDRHGNEAKNIKCIRGYITSLKSLRDIWFHVNKLGFKYLNLRQLNQDALENLFGIIRQHSPTNRNPTCSHFMGALKTTVVTKFTAPHSRGSNCEKDAQNLLTDFNKIIFNQEQETATETQGTDKIYEQLGGDDIPVINIVEEDSLEENNLADLTNQPIVYLSGYLACQLLKTSDCELCKKLLTSENTHEEMFTYIRLREWWPHITSLTYPSEELCKIIQTAVTVTEAEVCPRLHEKNILQLAVTLYEVKSEINWFRCMQHKNKIFNSLFARLALILIRRQCQRVNQALALNEEGVADAQKKAQQQGISK